MTVSLGSLLTSEGICLFVDLWEAQPRLGDPEWDSSWLNYPVRDDKNILTLAYIFDHAVCCASAASSGQSLHLITSHLRTK